MGMTPRVRLPAAMASPSVRVRRSTSVCDTDHRTPIAVRLADSHIATCNARHTHSNQHHRGMIAYIAKAQARSGLQRMNGAYLKLDGDAWWLMSKKFKLLLVAS
eukprot:6201350-Pleurochrysis_carterae.AAC.1